jgi:MFS family permease
MIFWLPTFLDFKGPLIGNQKGFISSMVELGGLVGVFGLGYFADRFDKRALLLSPLLFISSILMYLVSFVLN